MKKILTKNKKNGGILIVAALLLTCLLPIQTAFAEWPFAVEGSPVAVNGRILTTEKTGDISDWIEIARNGGYSLILRKNYINIYHAKVMYGKMVYNDPAWQFASFGLTDDYASSIVADKLNAWFSSTAAGEADKLPLNARLRDYTMHSNAKKVLGTCNTKAAMINGFSMPTIYQVGMGDDIAFLLSYGEATNYISKTHFMRASFANQPSSPIAVVNYDRIIIPSGCHIWLRSPGDISGSAGTIDNDNSSAAGRVFQSPISSSSSNYYGLIYPALWVDSDVFENIPNQDKPKPGKPIGVDGRTLTTDMTGDTSDWIEIAKNDAYSLIVRKNFINVYQNKLMYGTVVYNDPLWQNVSYGTSDNYLTSVVRTRINAWFNGSNPLTNEAERLPANARLRSFTLQNNAKHVLGTSTTSAALANGFSTPSIYIKGIGDDVAFALSYGESANFISRTHFLRYFSELSSHTSPAVAVTNYYKISIPPGYVYSMWLRSPGDVSGSAGSLSNNDGSMPGRVFQNSLSPSGSGYGLVYPALWVGSGIFGEKAFINVFHKDAETLEILEEENHVVSPGSYGPFKAKTYTGYDNGYLAPGSDSSTGNISVNQTKNITFVYPTKPLLTVTYYSNGGTGSMITDYVESGAFYSIKNQPSFTKTFFKFAGWNTMSDGSGSNRFIDEVIQITESLRLYAKWTPEF
jgi:hypothetical protein